MTSAEDRIAAVVARRKRAADELAATTSERDALLAELSNEDGAVPIELVKAFGLTGREAATIVQRVRGGRIPQARGPWVDPRSQG